MNNLTTIEKDILQIIQSDFPLTSRPYHVIGASIGISEHDVIDILTSLKTRKILREISAIFNAKYLGFTSALISFHVHENHIDTAAHIVSQHPGISHNYKRDHAFNLWFTLSVPQELDIVKHVQTLARMTSCTNYLYLPAVKTFKRRVQFDMNNEQKASKTSFQVFEVSPQMSSKITLPQEIQYDIMNELQKDLPLSPTPFKEIAEQFHIEQETLFNFLSYLKTSQKMSRFAGILKHRNVGFTANAMVAWKISEHILQAFVDDAVRYRSISHCYERVTYPEWPYNLYTMIHGKSRDATQQIIDELSSKFAMTCYEILYSSKEYKKQRINYFGKSIYEWDKQNI